MIRLLLIVTAGLEGATGAALLGLPSLVASLLLGAPLGSPAAQAIARVCGAALLSIAAACWLARNEPQSRPARGLPAALLLYNMATIAVLVHASAVLGLSGVGLWPAVLAHAALLVWCIACLRS